MHKLLTSQLAVLLIASILISSAMARVVSANLLGQNETKQSPLPTDQSLSELESLVQSIIEREKEIEEREALLEARFLELSEAETQIESSLRQLEQSQAELEARMFASNSASENDLENLTSIYEGMKPKDAAVLFESMDPEFAAGFLSRMTPNSASAIFSNLSPLTAYAVSATIAGRNVNAASEENE